MNHEVPNVVNQNLEEAKATLQKAGFENITITSNNNGDIGDETQYVVTRQDPNPNSSISAKDKIELSVTTYVDRANDVAQDLQYKLSTLKNSLDPRSFENEYCEYYPFMSKDDKDIYVRAYAVGLCYREQESVINEIKKSLKSPNSFALSSYEPSTIVTYNKENNTYTAYISVGYNASNSFGVSLKQDAKVRIYFTFVEDDGYGWVNKITVL